MTSTPTKSKRELAADAPTLKVDGVNDRNLYNETMLANFRQVFGYDFERYHGNYIKTD